MGHFASGRVWAMSELTWRDRALLVWLTLKLTAPAWFFFVGAMIGLGFYVRGALDGNLPTMAISLFIVFFGQIQLWRISGRLP